MQKIPVTGAFIALAALAGCAPKSADSPAASAAAPAADTAAQWQTLSGSFDAWNRLGDANWRLEEGAFVADSGKGMLVSKASYGDLEIDLEFWTDEPANSGVFLRAENPEDVTDTNAYEINIFDTRPDQTYATGALVNFSPPSQKTVAAGKWNTYHITLQGDHIEVILNGVTTVDTHVDAHNKAGPIGLQAYAGTVKFRNVRIRKL